MSVNGIKEISVFVDESGSFESDEGSSRFYLICFVLHDQAVDIAEGIAALEGRFHDCGLESSHCVHVGPLIRREGEYAKMLREERQAIFRNMMAFIRKSDIVYKCFSIDKHFDDSDSAVHDKLLQDITRFLVDNSQMLNKYDKLKIYYDNGQAQVKTLLEEAFAMFSSTAEFVPDVKPEKYRLFQAADLLCSVELVAAKMKACCMSVSEVRFFGEEREFKRNLLKKIRQKAMP